MNSKLPLFLSIPHAGLTVPPEVSDLCLLNPQQILLDGDEGANEIYSFTDQVADFVKADVARAFVDLNRSESDRRLDGVVKEMTIWEEQIYREPLSENLIDQLIAKYHRPYHDQIEAKIKEDFLLFVDCHTMAEFGPPVGPDTGQKRPLICLGDCKGESLAAPWIGDLEQCFARQFPDSVTVNHPFSGGYISQRYGKRSPWLQLEVSRTKDISNAQKRDGIFNALSEFCQMIQARSASE